MIYVSILIILKKLLLLKILYKTTSVVIINEDYTLSTTLNIVLQIFLAKKLELDARKYKISIENDITRITTNDTLTGKEKFVAL